MRHEDAPKSLRPREVGHILGEEIKRRSAVASAQGETFGIRTLARVIAVRETAGTSIDPLQAMESWRRQIHRVLKGEHPTRDNTRRLIAEGLGIDPAVLGCVVVEADEDRSMQRGLEVQIEAARDAARRDIDKRFDAILAAARGVAV